MYFIVKADTTWKKMVNNFCKKKNPTEYVVLLIDNASISEDCIEVGYHDFTVINV